VRRKTWVLAAAGVLIALAATGGLVVMSGPKQQALAAQPSPVNTAHVEKKTLSAMVSQAGTLTYRGRSDGSPYSVINQAQRTYTELPAVGQVISQGRVLYRVNDNPVVLLYGSTPAYQTLSAGASGPDVAELNADLVALGYATSAQLDPRSAFFGSATTAAVENATSVQAPPVIALCGLKTRSMYRKRDGRPRSMTRRRGEISAPAAAMVRASETIFESSPQRVMRAASARTAAAPPAPPTKK